MFMSVKQAAEKWGLSDRRVRILCAEGKIPGAFQEGRGWKIPVDAVKPVDGRLKSTESLLDRIDRKKAELDTLQEQIDQQKTQNEEMQRILSGDSDDVTEWVARDSYNYAAANERIFVDVTGN